MSKPPQRRWATWRGPLPMRGYPNMPRYSRVSSTATTDETSSTCRLLPASTSRAAGLGSRGGPLSTESLCAAGYLFDGCAAVAAELVADGDRAAAARARAAGHRWGGVDWHDDGARGSGRYDRGDRRRRGRGVLVFVTTGRLL